MWYVIKNGLFYWAAGFVQCVSYLGVVFDQEDASIAVPGRVSPTFRIRGGVIAPKGGTLF